MEDQRGLYYHPRPTVPAVRMYVRRGNEGDVEFRMWDAEHPEVWDKHDWLPFGVIEMAAEMFCSEHKDSDPLSMYDISVAEGLLREKALGRK